MHLSTPLNLTSPNLKISHFSAVVLEPDEIRLYPKGSQCPSDLADAVGNQWTDRVIINNQGIATTEDSFSTSTYGTSPLISLASRALKQYFQQPTEDSDESRDVVSDILQKLSAGLGNAITANDGSVSSQALLNPSVKDMQNPHVLAYQKYVKPIQGYLKNPEQLQGLAEQLNTKAADQTEHSSEATNAYFFIPTGGV